MRRTSLTFGRVAGIPLMIHVNWFLVAILVTWSLAVGYLPQEFPGWETGIYWTVALITALLFFGSVLLHELGHSLVAVREGVPVTSITLFIFGGVAQIANEPETPGAEFRIVIAGPLTSLLLAALFNLIGSLLWLGPGVTGVAIYLSHVNFILAFFNLIPGFPLDGGRILRAFLWRCVRDFGQATRWASNIGLAIALLFVAGGVVLMFLGSFFTGLWVAFIGWYLSTAAQETYRQSVEEAPPVKDLETIKPSPVVVVEPQPVVKVHRTNLVLATVVEHPEEIPAGHPGPEKNME